MCQTPAKELCLAHGCGQAYFVAVFIPQQPQPLQLAQQDAVLLASVPQHEQPHLQLLQDAQHLAEVPVVFALMAGAAAKIPWLNIAMAITEALNIDFSCVVK